MRLTSNPVRRLQTIPKRLVCLPAVWQGLGVRQALARCRAIVQRRRAALAKNLAVLGLLAAGANDNIDMEAAAGLRFQSLYGEAPSAWKI